MKTFDKLGFALYNLPFVFISLKKIVTTSTGRDRGSVEVP